jgi:hypothetical protein
MPAIIEIGVASTAAPAANTATTEPAPPRHEVRDAEQDRGTAQGALDRAERVERRVVGPLSKEVVRTAAAAIGNCRIVDEDLGELDRARRQPAHGRERAGPHRVEAARRIDRQRVNEKSDPEEIQQQAEAEQDRHTRQIEVAGDEGEAGGNQERPDSIVWISARGGEPRGTERQRDRHTKGRSAGVVVGVAVGEDSPQHVSSPSSPRAPGSDREFARAHSLPHRSARGEHLELSGRIRMTHYEDKSIALDEDGLTIKNYRKPGDAKRITYRTIRSFELFEMGFWSGRHRLVGIGFGRPRNWFPWDRDRKNKRTAISIDVGKRILPTSTPDDPEAVETILRESVGRH